MHGHQGGGGYAAPTHLDESNVREVIARAHFADRRVGGRATWQIVSVQLKGCSSDGTVLCYRITLYLFTSPRAQRRAGAATAGGGCTYSLRLAARDLHDNGRLGVAQAQSARRAQQEGPGAAARGRGGCEDPARPRTHRARHERACRRAGGARSTRHAQAGRRHLRPARRAAPPGRHSARLSAGGREGREGGESGEGRVRARKGDPRANEDRSCDRPCPTRPWLARERSLCSWSIL